MKLNQDFGSSSYRVRSYQPGKVVINDERFETSVVVSPDQLLRDWPPQSLADLTEAHLGAILALEPEVVILGTGPTQRFPASGILRTFLLKGIGIEVMHTAAAARTFNVLIGEDRRVAAALLLR